MTAGVHDADLLTHPLGPRRGLERKVALFGDWQSVHVGAERDHPAGFAAAQDADDTGVRHARRHLEPQTTQLVCNHACSSNFAIAQFGVLVEVTPPLHDGWRDLGYETIGPG